MSPYKVTKLDSPDAEPIVKTRRSINQELKDLKPGESVLGVVGDVREEVIPDPEKLTKEERAEKRALIAFLTKCISPPQLSQIYPNVARDKASFVRKLEKQTLGELKRIWGKALPDEDTITDELKAELQNRWEVISP